MTQKEFKKVAMLHKAADWNDVPVFAAAAVLTAAFLGGLGVGGLAGKVSEPSDYDLNNLEKEYELARLHRDNQTQQILSAREDAERRMRNAQPKSMRAV